MNFEDMIDDLEDMVIPTPDDTNDDTIEGADDPIIPPVEEPKTPEIPEATTDDDDESKAQITQYYNALLEYGALDVPEDFEFDGSKEGLEKAFELSDKNKNAKLAADLWEHLPEDFKPLLQYALNGGKSLDAFLETFKEVDYSQLDLTDENNQRKVLYDYYRSTSSYSEEKINRMINRLADIGDLEDEAVDAVKELVQYKEQQKEQLLAEAANQEQAAKEATKKQTEELTKLIETTSLIGDERKNRVKAFMFNPIKENGQYTTQLNQTMSAITTNPEHLIQLADILADYNPSVGFNFDRLERKSKTKDTKSFKDLLDQKLDPKTGLKGSNKKVINEDFDWDGFLNS